MPHFQDVAPWKNHRGNKRVDQALDHLEHDLSEFQGAYLHSTEGLSEREEKRARIARNMLDGFLGNWS